jgi:hypothetical protein
MQLARAHFSLHLTVITLNATTVKFELDSSIRSFSYLARTGTHVNHPRRTLRRNGCDFQGLRSHGITQ